MGGVSLLLLAWDVRQANRSASASGWGVLGDEGGAEGQGLFGVAVGADAAQNRYGVGEVVGMGEIRGNTQDLFVFGAAMVFVALVEFFVQFFTGPQAGS